jgi:stress response protein SCP2
MAVKEVSRGQRIKLADLGLGSTLTLAFPGGVSANVVCFGLDAGRWLADERYMTFFNQPRTPCRRRRLALGVAPAYASSRR